MKPRFLIAAAAATLASLSTNVWAQAFLSDPRVTNGLGVKAGSLELHPGVAGEFGYDSNYFQRSGDNPAVAPTRLTDPRAEPLIGAYRLRITPSLSFVTYGRRASEEGAGPPPSVNFSGNLAASYNALFAADSAHSSEVSNQSNNVSATVGLGADILPSKPLGVDIGGNFVRIIEASNDPDVSNAFRRDTIHGGAGINWRPGGGLFKWRLGYGITANLFEVDAFQTLNNVQHSLETSGLWMFLPRTALVYRGEIDFLNYGNGGADRHGGQLTRSLIGLNGLFTNHFGLLALGGWGASFFDGGSQNFDSFIGQAELTFYPSAQEKLPSGRAPAGLSAIALGYTRNFSISYLGDYYQSDRGYGNITYFIGERFVLTLGGGLAHITRPPVTAAGNVYQAVPENRVDATAFLEYRPGDSFGISLTFRYDSELNQVVIANDNLQFSRYQGFLGLRWFL